VASLLSPTPPKALYLLAFAWHLAWAATVPGPGDWDPAYYLDVARHLARGEGAVTDAVWNLGWLPPALRHPADLHWMPLPSRVLVPFVALPVDDWRAAQLATVLLAAGWAPLGWAWAARLDTAPSARWTAGVLAGLAGGYVRTVTTPDCIALYGLLGGAALLAASRARFLVTLPLVCAVALTRGDGFLLGFACLLAWPGLRGVAVALAGLGATLGWYARSWWLAGEGWLALRVRAANSVTLGQILSPTDPPEPDVAARLDFLAGEVGTVLIVALIVTGGLLLWPACWALFRRRSDRGLWPLPAYAVSFPVVIHLLAPAIAAEGSVYRSGAALFVPTAALAAAGVTELTRRYHPLFLPVLLVAGSLVASVLTGRQYIRVLSQLGADCEALAAVPAEAPVLSYDPIGVSARCGHAGAIMARGADLQPLVDRYAFEWALVAPADYDNGTVRAVDWSLAGWSPVSDRVWHRDR
jgi:hypothetical protein